MILFLSALKEERKAVQQAWGLVPAGTLQGWDILRGEACVHICTGMGGHRMKAALEFGLRNFQPRLVVLVGYSVGLKPERKVGDLVCDERSCATLLSALADPSYGLLFGRVATCGFLNTAWEKSAFAHENLHCELADMETEVVLNTLKNRTPALVVRVVSDRVDVDLPLDFSQLVTERGFPDLGGIVGRVLAKPTLIPKLLKLGKEADLATSALTRFLEQAESLLRDRALEAC